MVTNNDPVAVRNVVLVTGYDYLDPGRSFDEPALARVLDLFDQGEHLRYPLRFHLLSTARGVSAESVVFDRSYPMTSAVEGNLRALRMGKFWLRVEQRFAPVSRSHYPVGSVFIEPREKAPDEKRVLSMVDVYRYLYSFWEGAKATSPKNPVAYDTLVELSFFSHAAMDSIHLVNSADRKSGSRRRDEGDKDARTKDFSASFSADPDLAPVEFWKGIARMFDRAAGRVRIWGADAVGDGPFYGALIEAALAARRRARHDSFPRLAPAASGADPIPVTDPQARDRLGSGADQLTLERVKEIVAAGLRASYASTLQAVLSVTTYTAPPGTSTAPERPTGKGKRLLFAVPRSLEEIVEFQRVNLDLVTDPEGRRYAVLGPRPKAMPEPKSAEQPLSPLAGLHLFREYDAPFVLEGPTGRARRDGPLQKALDSALRAYPLGLGLPPEKRPAIVIADVSGAAPYPYAATLNDEVRYYSASLLKVAAMFAALRLREVVRALAVKLGARPEREVLGLLAPALNLTIDRAIDFSRTKVVAPPGAREVLAWKHRVPRHQDLFASPAPPWNISERQRKNVGTIFTDPDESNGAAQELIHSLGYAWINGVMRLSGFPGVWLAGDYSGTKVWPYAKIPTNGGLAAQVTTARDLAALFVTIARQSADEAATMRKWLPFGKSWADSPDEELPVGLKFLGAKVGLTPDHIYSEATIIGRREGAPTYVVAWLNCGRKQVDTVLAIVRHALSVYTPTPRP